MSDRMQAAFEESMASAGLSQSKTPQWALFRMAFELGYLAGEREQLRQFPARVDRVLERATKEALAS